MSKETVEDDKLESIKVKPQHSLTSKIQGTISADYVKVMLDHEIQMCTFVFFHRHPSIVNSERGVQLEGTTQEAFMEVKVPLPNAFALGLYINTIFQNLSKDPSARSQGRVDWGPVSIRQKKKENA